MPSPISLVAVLGLAAATMPPSPVRIALEIDAGVPIAISRLALEETSAIWKLYGVAVVGPDALPSCLGNCLIDARLPVRLGDDEAVGSGAELVPLGGIRFGRDGLPESVIRLRYRTLTTIGLRDVTVGDLHEAQWPRALRNFVLGRIVGRVIAHEIGHWLLQSRDHASSGLMRAIQRPADLAEPSRVKYGLTPDEVGRLKQIIARQLSARAP